MSAKSSLPSTITRSLLPPASLGSGRRHCPIQPCPPTADARSVATADFLIDFRNNCNMRGTAQLGNSETPTCDVLANKAGDSQYQCKQCGNTYSNVASLNVHLNVHSKSKCFECDKCFKSYSRRSSLYNHKKSHSHSDDAFKCTICGAEFKSREALLDHQPSHLDKNGLTNYEAQCFVCAAILSTKFGLKLHIVQKHPEIIKGNTKKNHTCCECNKKYSNETLLKAHMKTHSAVKVHACPSCDYCATTRVGLQRHVDRIHLKVRKFECAICAKFFVSQPDLKVHMLRHYKIKPVQCELCLMRFYSTRELRKHKFTHSGQKPYRCDDCDVSFAYTESLKRHISTHLSHPVTCVRCLRQFSSRKSLTKHMLSHPPASNIFKCSDCGKSYKNFKCLETHKTKLKHRSTIYCCHDCGLEFQSVDLFNSHDRNGHENSFFICKICNISLKRECKLAEHMRIGHAIDIIRNPQSRSSVKTISLKQGKKSNTFKGDKVSADISRELDSMNIENNYNCAIAVTDSLFDECNPIEGVEITTTTIDTASDNNSPIEGVEVTTVNDTLMDVFSCNHCDKLFLSELDRTEHARHRHAAASPEPAIGSGATSIQVVAGVAIEHLGSTLADLIEIDFLSVPGLL